MTPRPPAAPDPAPRRLPFAGPARPLPPGAVEAAAADLDVLPAALEAVVAVETGGAGGFLNDGSGRPRILFEPHVFGRLTDFRWNQAYPEISRARFTPGIYLGGAREYDRLILAAELDRRAALRAASWGLFQIMGSNHVAADHPTAEAFVRAMAEGEAEQLAALIAFLRHTGIDAALRRLDWLEFARRYNGPRHAENRYVPKITAAFVRAQGRARDDERPGDKSNALPPTVRVGCRGEHVRRLQRILARRTGEAHLAIDGIFGRATEAATLRFQRSEGLAADGIAGPRTWTALLRGERAAAEAARQATAHAAGG